MLQRLRHRAHGQEGFTLIELLVVILIIGILAAVAIPVFLNQTGKAQDANTKSDLNSAQTAMETYYTDNQGYGATLVNLEGINPALTQAASKNSLAVVTPGSALYGATDPSGTSGTTVVYNLTETSSSGVLYAIVKWSDGTSSTSCQIPANASNFGSCKPSAGGTFTVKATTQNGVW